MLYRIHVGIGLDKHGRPLPATTLAVGLASFESTLVDTFGGFSRMDSKGAYRHANGRIVHEPSRTYDVYADADSVEVYAAAELLRDALRQESVLVSEIVETHRFV